MEKQKIESEHVPVQVIDYILDCLIEENNGRKDNIQRRKYHILYLLQSYNIFFYDKALFDTPFALELVKGVRLVEKLYDNKFIKTEKPKMNISYNELFSRIETIYNRFWHYNYEDLKRFVFFRLPSFAKDYIVKIDHYAVVCIDKNDIKNDRLNTREILNWTYELSKSEQEVEEWKDPTSETYQKEAQKKITTLKKKRNS